MFCNAFGEVFFYIINGVKTLSALKLRENVRKNCRELGLGSREAAAGQSFDFRHKTGELTRHIVMEP